MSGRRSSFGTSVEFTTDWRWEAVCATHGDPRWWVSDVRADRDRAAAYCATCPVKATCLREGLAEPEGIWGGLGPAQRRALRRTDGRDVAGIEHGTRKGYQRCTARPEGACEDCKTANAEYVADKRAARNAA